MASAGIEELAARKQLLIAQADLHRHVLAMETARLGAGAHGPGAFVERNRWWLIGGAIVGGVVIARRWRSFANWLPPIVAMARAFMR